LLRQLQRGEIQYDQQTYGLLNEVKDILDTGNPAKMKSNFETQLGIKMNDEQAKYVFENRENMTMRDELEMLTGAINSNNASAVTRARMEFTKTYLESDAFKSSENAKIFPEAKVLGGVKKETPTVLGSNSEHPSEVKTEPEPFQPISAEESTQVPEYTNGTFRKFINQGRGKAGVSAIAKEYAGDSADVDFTRAKMTEAAKKYSNNGENVSAGWEPFRKEFVGKLRTAKNDPAFDITDPKASHDFEWLYKRLSRNERAKELGMTDDGGIGIVEGKVEPVRNIEIKTRQFNRTAGLPEDSMNVISISKQLDYSEVKGAVDSRNKAAYLETQMERKGYVPVGLTAKGVNKFVGVKFEPKMVERFDASPDRYQLDGEKLTNKYDKFIRTYIVDVLGLPKDIKSEDFVKRSNLLFNRYDRYAAPDENDSVSIHILTSKKIKDVMPGSVGKEMFENSEHSYVKNSIESFESGSVVDGKLIIGENLWNRLMKGLSIDGKRTGVKPIIEGMAEDEAGNMVRMIQKGHAIKADSALREELKREYGFELNKDEAVTFNTNSKIGPKTGTLKAKMSDFYALSLGAGEESRSTLSMQRKFLSGDEGILANSKKDTETRLADFKAFSQEIEASSGKDELRSVIDKYAEKYGFKPENLFYGDLEKAHSLGAAKITLGKGIEKLFKNILFENILVDQLPNSGKVFISAPIKLKLDGPNAPARYLKHDEVVLGEEKLKELKLKEGDEVAVIRHPSPDINNIVLAKVINGSKFGHTSLGTEHGMISSANERLRLQGDQDGDTMAILKIGEGGISKDYATAIKKRGSKVIPFTEVNPNPEASKPVTQQSLRSVISGQLVGDDQTVRISMMNRVMDMLIDNKITINISASKGQRSNYTIYSNGKIVETSTLPIKKGQEIEEDMTFTPKWDFEERQLRTQALQEAVDSKKSHDIIRRTDNNDPLWITRQVFRDSAGKKLDQAQATAVSEAIKPFGDIFDTAKHQESFETVNEVVKGKKVSRRNPVSGEAEEMMVRPGLSHSIELFNNIKKTGEPLTPLEEKILSLKDLESFAVSKETKISADKTGASAVRQNFEVDRGNVALNDLRKISLKAKVKYFSSPKKFHKAIHDGVLEYYQKNLEAGKYTKEDLDAIAYWASTSDEANFGLGFREPVKKMVHFNSPRYIYRFNGMINESPEVAKVYYEAMEGSGKKVEAPKTTSNDGTGGPGWFSGITDKFKSLFGPKTEAKTNESVPADPSTDLNKYKALAAISGAKQAQPTTISEDIPEYTGVFSPDGYVKAYPSLQKAIGKKNLDVKKFLYAIGQNETNVLPSDERYGSSQDSGVEKLGKTLGIYRVSEGDLSTYGKRYLGREITKDEFLNSPELQNQYLTNMAQYWFDLGFTPEEIADIHRSGVSGSLPEGKGKGKYTHPEYITKFNENYYK
jgi:hypothetical protein